MWSLIKQAWNKINWKKVRDTSLNTLAALVFLYAFAGTTYGLWQAHQNNLLQQAAVQTATRRHHDQVIANQKEKNLTQQLINLEKGNAAADTELGQFAAYVVEVGVANCADIEGIASKLHIMVPDCPIIPDFGPISQKK